MATTSLLADPFLDSNGLPFGVTELYALNAWSWLGWWQHSQVDLFESSSAGFMLLMGVSDQPYLFCGRH